MTRQPTPQVRYDYAVTRATRMIRRAEREGLGRNAGASLGGMRSYLLAAQKIGARELPPNMRRADAFGALIDRAEQLGVEL